MGGWSGDGLITLQGLNSAQALASLADGLPGVTLSDRAGKLNALFSATRLEAAELKAASYAVAALLICLFLGRAAMLRILAVPVAATLLTLACLGYVGQPITLFSLFGLLLVSAIAVDYAIFMYEGVGGTPACLIGIVLGALTTLLVWHAGRQRHTGDLELRRHGRNRRTGLPRLRGLDPPA